MGNRSEVTFQKGIFSFPSFLPQVLAAFSSRDFDAGRDSPFFLRSLGVDPARFFTVRQVHEDRVILVTDPAAGEEADADALLTEKRGITLLIRTADCVPVFFFDPVRPAVGLVHAGWQGARKGIVRKMAEAFKQHFNSQPSKLRAALGPAIQKSCYEVGPEFFDYFPGFVEKTKEQNFFDLPAFVKQELIDAGISESFITDSGLCTACSTDRFFSARREGQSTGRFLSAIMLK